MVCNKPNLVYHCGYDERGLPIIRYSSKFGGSPIWQDCGSCLGCRLKKSKQWAVRCLKELENWSQACFVTLTYNDNCLPYAYSHNVIKGYDDYGNEIPIVEPTLYRRDLQLFVKRLRRELGKLGLNDKIKVFYAGEYGDENHRPHYHLIIYGFRPFDLVDYKVNRFKQQLYTSEFLESLWYRKSLELDKKVRRKWKKVPCGFVVVGDVSFQSCSYVARYILKKQSTIDNGLHAYCKEFLGVSNGIGLKFLEDNYKTIFANGSINYVVDDKIKTCPIPRYYLEKLADIDEELYLKQKSLAYEYLERKIYSFFDDEKKLLGKCSNEKALRKKTFERFKRSFENEKSI